MSYLFIDVRHVTYAEMLYRTNLIAYVPADSVSRLPSNTGKKKIFNTITIEIFSVNIYDDQRKTHVLEFSNSYINTNVANKVSKTN